MSSNVTDCTALDRARKKLTSMIEAKYKAELENKMKFVDFLIKSIKEKEANLECPVCLVTAEAPIYMCPESHMIW